MKNTGKMIGAAILTAILACGMTSCGIATQFIRDEKVVEETVELKTVSDLTMELTCADITIQLGKEDKLHYKMHKNLVPEITQENGKLNIRQKEKNGFNFSFMDNEQDTNTMVITLNQKTLDNLDIDVTSGDISIDGFDLNGSIETTSGDISICNAEKGKTLELETTSGDITVSNSSFACMYKTQSSGDLKMEQVNIKEADLETTSGRQTISKSQLDDVTIDTTSGSTSLELIGSESDYNYDISCTSGDIRIAGAEYEKSYQKDHHAKKTIQSQMTSGSVSVTFTN